MKSSDKKNIMNYLVKQIRDTCIAYTVIAMRTLKSTADLTEKILHNYQVHY